MILKKYLGNALGWSTKRKLLVIEADDFGWSNIYRRGDVLDYLDLQSNSSYFLKHDKLEDRKDLDNIYGVLKSVKDKNDNHAVLTPLVVMAYPDFEKIANSDFQNFYYKPFYDLVSKLHGEETWDKWQEGIESGLLVPEYHGRDHINVSKWLQELKNNKSIAYQAFKNDIATLDHKFELDGVTHKSSAAYIFLNKDDVANKIESLESGINLFNDVFGRKPTLFTPPGSGYSYVYNQTLVENGVKSVQLQRRHNLLMEDGSYKAKNYYFGEKAIDKRLLITPRNCLFEPHNRSKDNWVKSCFTDVSVAFQMRKPAIISTHRINFVNQEKPENGNGLEKLEELLNKLVHKYPDIEFVSKNELLEIMTLSKY